MTSRLIMAMSGMLLTVSLAFADDHVKLDAYGDPLPSGALMRLGTIRLQSQGGFAWMPDGQTIVTACQERLWFWHAEDGRPIESAVVRTGPSVLPD